MKYTALTVGIADDLSLWLQTELAQHSLYFEAAPTVQEAKRQLSQKAYHLLITDLEYLRSTGHTGWLENIVTTVEKRHTRRCQSQTQRIRYSAKNV